MLYCMSKRADPGKQAPREEPGKDPNREPNKPGRTTRDKDGALTEPDPTYGSDREKYKAEFDVLEKAYRAFDVVKLRDYANNHTAEPVRKQARYWLESTPVSDYILVTENYRNDVEQLKRIRDKPLQDAFVKQVAQNRINILTAQGSSEKTERGRDNNSNTEQDQQRDDSKDDRTQEREDQKQSEEKKREEGTAPEEEYVALMEEEDPNAPPSAPSTPMQPMPGPNPNIPIRGGVSGGPTRRQRYADLQYPSEFFADKEKFNEVFRYAARNPYSYVHPYLKKPDMINIVENRRNFLSLK